MHFWSLARSPEVQRSSRKKLHSISPLLSFNFRGAKKSTRKKIAQHFPLIIIQFLTYRIYPPAEYINALCQKCCGQGTPRKRLRAHTHERTLFFSDTRTQWWGGCGGGVVVVGSGW